MKLKTLTHAAFVVLTTCLLRTASAQPPVVAGTQNDYHWRGLGTLSDWDDANNWEIWTNLGNVTPANMVDAGLHGVPVSGGASFVGNVWLDAANGVSLITIPAGSVESPGVPPPGSPEVFNTIFGPEFGASLDIYGTLNFDWLLFPVQNNPAPAVRTHVNLYNGAVVTCVGASGTGGAAMGIGDSWFYQAAPYETMNLYGNATYTSPGGAGLWIGGHLNVYDTSTFTVDGYVNMDVIFNQSDGTRSIVMGGGSFLVPEGTITGGGNSGSAASWITRGILRAYGKGYDTNDIVITDNGTNTIITTVALGGALQRVYFQPLILSNVNVGTAQLATLSGDYPSVSGVLLSSSEPGVSSSVLTTPPVYTSSDPQVAIVDTNGVVTAVGYGSSTISATVGAFGSTTNVTLTVTPVVPGLAHEYQFNESPGSLTTADAVGGAPGTVNGDATFTGSGQLVLSGNVNSSVTLPAAILSNYNQVTIEAWATFPSTINAFANLWAFGNTDLGSPLSATYGDGENYITFSPHTGGLTTQANFGQGDPGSGGEWDAVLGGVVLDNQTNVQVVAVFNPYAGTETLYTNGVLAVTQTMFNNLLDPVAHAGPLYNGQSILAYTLGADPLNYIGQSLYINDPGMHANIDEFRIYTNALTSAQIAADHALGPNQLIGTGTSVSLSVSQSGGNIVVKWPTSSALVALMSSPALGAGANWTAVAGALTTDGSGNYQMTVPATGAARFFRLQQ